ncbi:hypothetical protein VT50_0202720 [Streptomyces antioxidans]|uniref:Uncharacterized protein n=1 Tax=Streptomyces antioxidans TaxID=1507734 RepID=A0A1V4DBJ3_9ACTN|nr:hypothetical protein [Streptomyces antioxidans]OPF83732.1 hypothetical protein VT50_0202720 [Streptomyces antioxidans]
MDYTRVDDGSATGWLGERLTEFDGTVAGVAPGGFGAYARIVHPAYHGDAAVAWYEVATANGRAAHALMQWDHIVGARRIHEQPGVWDEAPYEGNVPEPLLRQLARVLREHTGTPGDCWFGLWEGWGDVAIGPGDTARFEIPHRGMLLLSGSLDTVHRSSLTPGPWAADDPSVAVAAGPKPRQPAACKEPLDRDPFWRAPNLWWPEDRAWCVATDIDFTSTYLGASPACVDAVLAADGIEAYRAHLIDPVTDESDHLNPRPA